MPRRPARGVAYSASIRTRYPLAPCIPLISGRPPVAGFPASGHGPCHRPACPSCHSGHNRARVAFCLPCRHGLGDALAGTVWWPSSSGRTPIQPPVLPVVLTCKYAVKGVNTGDCGGAVGFIPVLKHGAFSSTSRNLHRLRREIRRGRYLRIRQVRGSVATSGERV